MPFFDKEHTKEARTALSLANSGKPSSFFEKTQNTK